MEPLKTLILDLETLRGPDEVGGWGMAPLMGVSILVFRSLSLYHTKISTQPLQTYIEPITQHREEIIHHLKDADILVSYNGMSFDYRVISGELSLSEEFKKSLNAKTIDFCFTLRIKHNLNISLINVASRTLKEKVEKSVHGEKMVEYWRSRDQNKRQIVIQHCVDDVNWTAKVFLEMLKNTQWENKSSPSGRILYFNPKEAEDRKNGGTAARRIISSCIIPYPQKLQEFLIEQKRVKKWWEEKEFIIQKPVSVQKIMKSTEQQ